MGWQSFTLKQNAISGDILLEIPRNHLERLTINDNALSFFLNIFIMGNSLWILWWFKFLHNFLKQEEETLHHTFKCKSYSDMLELPLGFAPDWIITKTTHKNTSCLNTQKVTEIETIGDKHSSHACKKQGLPISFSIIKLSASVELISSERVSILFIINHLGPFRANTWLQTSSN